MTGRAPPPDGWPRSVLPADKGVPTTPPPDRFGRHPPRDLGPRINEQIRISPIRVIGAAGEQLGIIPTAEAQALARDANLDLVEVAPTERPPVCKIMDYGKF